jgi:hypothetical protein
MSLVAALKRSLMLNLSADQRLCLENHSKRLDLSPEAAILRWLLQPVQVVRPLPHQAAALRHVGRSVIGTAQGTGLAVG